MPLDDERLRQLGLVAATAAELEYYLYALCCELADPDPATARAAVGFRGFTELTKFTREHLLAAGLAHKQEQLDTFLQLAIDAMNERDRLLHSHWVSDSTQARRQRRRDPGVRLEVDVEDIAAVVEQLDVASSGMNFMWIEAWIALGRVSVVNGIPQLTDWTGLPKQVERWKKVTPPVQGGRWAHGFFSGTGTLSATAVSSKDIQWYPSDPEEGLDRRNR